MTTTWGNEQATPDQVAAVSTYIALTKQIMTVKTFVRNLENQALAVRTELREVGVPEADIRHFERAVEKGEL